MDEEEQETPRVVEISKPPVRDEEDPTLEVQDTVEPQETIETPHETISTRKRLAWDHDIIQEEEIYGALEGSKRLRLHSNYVSLIFNLVDKKPTCFIEASKKKEWMDAMTEESILKNDVWEVVPRPKNNLVVSSKWIFKTKNSVDGSIGKFKEIFFVRGFSQKEGIDYEEKFCTSS